MFQTKPTAIQDSEFTLLIRMIPVQPKQRNQLNKISSVLLYVLDYIIIFKIIILSSLPSIVFQNANTIVIVIQVLRVISNFGYIFYKQKIYLCLQKLSIIALSLFQVDDQLFFLQFLIILDLFTCVMWSLSIEQKNIHFDSRLFVYNALLKQVLICFVIFTWNISRGTLRFYWFFQIFVCILLISTDYFQNIYNKKFKNLLLCLDVCCLVSLCIPKVLLMVGLKIQYYYVVSATLANVFICTISVYLTHQDFKVVLFIDPWAKNLSQQKVLQYFICISQMCKLGDQNLLIEYVINHTRKCEQTQCFLKYHFFSMEKHKRQKLNVIIQIFILQQLYKLSKKHQILKQYLIFNYYEKSYKIVKYIDKKNFFHQRLAYYFHQESLNQSKHNNSQDNVLIKLLISQQIIPQIKNYVGISFQFWSQLLEFNVNGSKVIDLAIKKVELANIIDKTLSKNITLDKKTQFLVNVYYMYLANSPHKLLNQFNQISSYLSGLCETSPTVIVSAQKQDFLRITNANISCVRATGFTKSQLTTVTVDNLWEKEIRQGHIQIAKKRANFDQIHFGELIRSYAFLKNKYGFMVVTDAIVYYFDDFAGKKWCVVLHPYLVDECVIIFNYRRQMLGITQHSLLVGLTTSLQGCKMSQSIFNECMSKGQMNIDNKKFFEDNDFKFPHVVNQQYFLKYETKIGFLGKIYYHIFTISKKPVLKRNKNSFDFEMVESKLYMKITEGKSRFSDMFLKQCKQIPFQQQELTFQFNFDFLQQKFKGSTTTNCSKINIQSKEFVQYDDNFQFKKQLYVLNEQIIEMRLWHNQLDYLQNIKHPKVEYQTINLSTNNTQGQLIYQKAFQQMEINYKKVPQSVIILRVLFSLVVAVLVIMVLYIFLIGLKNQNYVDRQINFQTLIIRQLKQLLSFGTILVQTNYNLNLDPRFQIEAMAREVDSTYKEIQKIGQMSVDIYQYKIENYTLLQADKQYRLIIQKSLGIEPIQIEQVQTHIANYIFPGWFSLIRLAFKNAIDGNQNILTGYLIFMVIPSVCFVMFLIAYLKFRFRIQNQVIEICTVFKGIDQRAINQQIAKIKSFNNFLDFNDNLFDQQTLEEIRQQQNEDILYQKRIVNVDKHLLETLLFILMLFSFFLCPTLICYEKYQNQNLSEKHISLRHYTQIKPIISKIIWLGVNKFPRNVERLQQYYLHLINHQRYYQTNIKQLSSVKGVPEQLITIINQQLYLDGCKYLQEQCKFFMTEELHRRSSKQLIVEYSRKYKKMLSRINLNKLQFLNSMDAKRMYKMQKYYFSFIANFISQKIMLLQKVIAQQSQIRNFVLLLILLSGFICGIVSYLKLSYKLYSIIDIMKILKLIPFKILANNTKYINFLNNNKTVLR